ncbi:hypothetical protein [Limibacterium fermenti]|uniref:hypothetical protein n=1 Tax=Limibacterium fermenti TaxID=3229863 RepID=UPI000E851E3D|nr:hypothetical protein [Porphyromonadaceae bacterium]
MSRSVDIEGRTYAYRKISDRGMLNGLGELMDEEMKNSENMNVYIRYGIEKSHETGVDGLCYKLFFPKRKDV